MAGLGFAARADPIGWSREGPSEPAQKPSAEGWPEPPASARRARVVEVTDGDTVVIEWRHPARGQTDRDRARLIGVDTPEKFGRAECYGEEASGFTERALSGRDVLVDFDVERRDRYGRALVYIWTRGRLFNADLVASGYAQQMTVPPNVRYAELFGRLVREAREGGRGLWGPACAVRDSMSVEM